MSHTEPRPAQDTSVAGATADPGVGAGSPTSGPTVGSPPRGESATRPHVRSSRRRFLGGAALTAAGAAVGAAVGVAVGSRGSDEPASAAVTLADFEVSRASATVPFYGTHQAGVITRQQDRLMFAAFDLITDDVGKVQHLLGTWAAMAAQFTAGNPVRTGTVRPAQAPPDTGETMDLGPYALTLTVGFGPGLFDDRFGLADRLPAALQPLGTIPGDAVLRPELSGGDLCVQACADDPQVVFHAVRNLARAATGVAAMRWSQLGFGRASATGAGQTTPRNLFGFKDGTNNIHADDAAHTDRFVWVDDSADQPWMVGGTYLVARKIRMEIQSWDADSLGDQERIFGRKKDTGAPLTGGTEFTPVDFAAVDADGAQVIDPNSHIRLAAPEENGGIRILRRGYNYTDGQDSRTGKLDAGLFFIAFQRDPHTQFKVLQTRLGRTDAMNEYVAHIGSAVFACPPGISAAGDWFGKALFNS